VIRDHTNQPPKRLSLIELSSTRRALVDVRHDTGYVVWTQLVIDVRID
jgi:hypothetical protein